MHGQAMIHGDLKGVRLKCWLPPCLLTRIIKANILIDKDRHARLADFGLLTITSDPTNFAPSSSHITGGTTRWMSPEILDPDLFGFKDSRPTKESDCYALGMVVLEVLSGRPPFTPDKDFIVMRKVIDGERPVRPEGLEGAWFTDDLWRMLELCWTAQPDSRPSIEAVLECLERVSGTWKPPSQQVGEGVGANRDDLDYTIVSYYSACPSIIHPVYVLTAPPTPTRIHSIKPLTTFDRPSGGGPRKGVTGPGPKAFPTIPPPCSFEHLGEIIASDETTGSNRSSKAQGGGGETLTLTRGQGVFMYRRNLKFNMEFGIGLNFHRLLPRKNRFEPQQREDAVKVAGRVCSRTLRDRLHLDTSPSHCFLYFLGDR